MRVVFTLVVIAVAGLGGCSCDDDRPPSTTDAGPSADAGVDAGRVDAGPVDAGPGVDGGPGVDAGPAAARQIVFQPSGGGQASSSGYRLRLSVGAPQPTGTASSANNRVTTGPAAARP